MAFCVLAPVILNFDLYDLGLGIYVVKKNHHAKYLGQTSFRSNVTFGTSKHTDRHLEELQ